MIDRISKYLKSLEKEAIPQLSVNCVILGFHEKTLKVIVNKFSIGERNMLVLPGGYVGQTENLLDAVERMVAQSTGLRKILFKQFAVFGEASRSFGSPIGEIIPGVNKKELEWLTRRFVSICYLALVDYNKIELTPTEFPGAAQWLSVGKGKMLSLDHRDILESARESLLKELPYSPIASNLLPQKFTLPELHALVEAILGRPVDRPNFRRKILKSDMIVKVGQDHSGKRRPPDFYTFINGRKTSLIEEFNFGF